jgi:hypothetical protein
VQGKINVHVSSSSNKVTPTTKFHSKINSRRRKNFIQRLKNGQGWVTNHEGKENLIKCHFSTTMGKGPPHQRDFNRRGGALSSTSVTLGALGILAPKRRWWKPSNPFLVIRPLDWMVIREPFSKLVGLLLELM